MKPQSDSVGSVALSSPQELRVKFLTELAELPPLAERWEALNRAKADHDAPFFQSFAWNYHVAGVRLSRSPGRFRLLVATVWQGDELIGVWPLSLQRSAGVWLARNLDDPFGQFGGVAFRAREDIAPGVRAIVKALRQHADGMQIQAVVAGSGLHEALMKHGAKTLSTQDAVIVDLRPHESFDALLQTIGNETRTSLRKKRAKLMRTPGVTAGMVTSAGELAPLMKYAYDERFAWLQRNGKTSPAFRTDEFRPVIEGLAQASGVDVVGSAIKIGDDFIAVGWGFAYAGAYYDYMSGMDTKYLSFSPGRHILASFLEECFRRGIKTAELLAPVLDYKLEWTKTTKKVESISLLFSVKSRVAINGAGWAIANARRVSRMLPESLRKTLVSQLNRK